MRAAAWAIIAAVAACSVYGGAFLITLAACVQSLGPLWDPATASGGHAVAQVSTGAVQYILIAVQEQYSTRGVQQYRRACLKLSVHSLIACCCAGMGGHQWINELFTKLWSCPNVPPDVPQITWDVFVSRYGSGRGAVPLLYIPAIAMFFCCVTSQMSSGRWV
jgi:hypothetical protein